MQSALIAKVSSWNNENKQVSVDIPYISPIVFWNRRRGRKLSEIVKIIRNQQVLSRNLHKADQIRIIMERNWKRCGLKDIEVADMPNRKGKLHSYKQI